MDIFNVVRPAMVPLNHPLQSKLYYQELQGKLDYAFRTEFMSGLGFTPHLYGQHHSGADAGKEDHIQELRGYLK